MERTANSQWKGDFLKGSVWWQQGPYPSHSQPGSPEAPEVNDGLLFTKVRKRVQIKEETKRL